MTFSISRTSRVFAGFGTVLTVAACSDVPVTPTLAPTSAALSSAKQSEGSSSLAWNKIARELVVARPASPGVQGRFLVSLSIAQYNAIVAAEGARGHPSAAAAAAGASVVVLKSFYPADEALFDAAFLAQREADSHRNSFAAGEAMGRAIGAQVVAYAADDRVNLMAAPPNPGGPGNWTGVNSLRGFIGARTFALTSDDQFRPGPPPAFASEEFNHALAEIRALSDAADPDQLAIAILWAGRAPAYMNELAAEMIVNHGRSEREGARILATANMADFDVQDACFDAKLAYYLIRPSQADPHIKVTVGLPNHPSYPSGHSCIMSAYATVLKDAFPDESERLQALVEEAGLARMYGGLHYQFDCLAGRELGRQVAEYVLHAAGPKGHDPILLD
jgi:hypothetical protein